MHAATHAGFVLRIVGQMRFFVFQRPSGWSGRIPLDAAQTAAVAGTAAAVLVRVDGSVSLHVVQHIVLMTASPPLLLRAFPRLTAGTAFRAGPATALIVGGVLLVYAVHVPALFNADVKSLLIGVPAHLALLSAGCLMALPFSGERCVAGMGAVLLLTAAEFGVGVLGMWLTWFPHVVYELPPGQNPAFGLDPSSDQSLSGALILVLAEPILAVELLVLFFRALREDERST